MKIIQKDVFGTLGTGISNPRVYGKKEVLKDNVNTHTLAHKLIGFSEGVPSVPSENKEMFEPSGAPGAEGAEATTADACFQVPTACRPCANDYQCATCQWGLWNQQHYGNDSIII